jgi:hypothetical protein
VSNVRSEWRGITERCRGGVSASIDAECLGGTGGESDKSQDGQAVRDEIVERQKRSGAGIVLTARLLIRMTIMC